MTQTLVIGFPLPPYQLSPNSRVHWRVKARHVKATREMASLLTKAAINLAESAEGPCGCPWGAARLQATWYWKDLRYVSDDDNLVARMKAVRDGIADGGVVVDDQHFLLACPKQDIDPDNPRLEVEIEELSSPSDTPQLLGEGGR